ncbi:MAG: hypothetical protein KBA62_06435 [Polaromonas sp.]|jgi:hypothetical protein|nr:hypothetical protein [Polaromonas sp.]MBP6156460.1 hypothetical protein [Polaromonas sp.]MBP7115933.1 hypothetical protein [Polaromonas sp.]MBP8873423.1 hypothetical protein [Polaromonas sp.]MBP9830824.1 hypothetical protein [Polaromonas sp.]
MIHIKRIIKSTLALGLALSLLAACSSSDPTNVAADFSAQGIKGKIEGEIVVIDLSELGNCATTIENMTIAAETFGASVSPDPRVARDYTNPVEFTVTAPDGTKAVFKVKVKGAGCLSTPTPKPVVKNTPLELGDFTCQSVRFKPLTLAESDETTVYCEISAVDPDGIDHYDVQLYNGTDEDFYSSSLKFHKQDGDKILVELSCSNTFYDNPILQINVAGKLPNGTSESESLSTITISAGDICPNLIE